jgi:hypothetical protein
MANKRLKKTDEAHENDQDKRMEQLLAVLPVCFKVLKLDTTTSLLARFAASAKELQKLVSHDLPSSLFAPHMCIGCKAVCCPGS